MQYSIVLNYKIARLSRRRGGWRNFLNLLLFLKFSAFLVALTLTCCFVFMHCTSSCIIVGLSDYHALQSYQSTTHGVMHWSIQSRLEQNVLVLLELKIFLGSEFVLLFEDEMMRIGLNFWFFDKFASSLSITNCVKNKSQKVTKEMKTPKINNSCPQKNYVTIGLKCLMPSFEENHKNHHKNISDIFSSLLFIFRLKWWSQNILPSFSCWHLTPFLRNILKWPSSFSFEICSWLEMFEFWKSSPTEFSNSKSWDESRAWDFNQRDNNHNGW